MRYSILLVLLAAAVACVGCGSQPAVNTVSGKVSFQGQAVSGQVTFIGPDQREISTPIKPDGTYTILAPGKGDHVVLVKSLAAAGAAPRIKVKGPLPMMANMPEVGSPGAAPPAKYARPAGGLKFAVTGGHQTFDIDLKP